MTRLAVQMIARNAELYVADAINSALVQRDAPDLDIVVVDDGSSDATPDILAALAADNPEIRVVTTGQQGIPAARNTALAAMRPDVDYVTFLDADDLVPAGRYAEDLAKLTADPGLGLVYRSIRLFIEQDPHAFAPRPGSDVQDLRGVHLGTGLFRADVVRQIGQFDLSLEQGEDIDWLLRIFEAGFKHLILDDIGIYYRRHQANVTSDLSIQKQVILSVLHKSIRRRREGKCAPLPEGLFDAKQLERGMNL